MKKKIIILGLVLLVILYSFAFFVSADTGRQVKTILRKSLFEYFQHPIKTTLDRSEVIDLLEAYLEEEDISNVDLEAARSHSGKSIRSIINKAINNYGTEPECVDKCGDGDCAAIVCTGIGCPCWETSESCPEDCGDECIIDEDCGEGKVCTNGECEYIREPDECSPAGTKVCSEDGKFLKTCIVDTGNIGRLIWRTETCPNGCENGACKVIPLTCGDGVLDSGERCDGDELGGATCLNVSHYFVGGSLSCRGDCTFNTSLCERNDSSNLQYPGGIR